MNRRFLSHVVIWAAAAVGTVGVMLFALMQDSAVPQPAAMQSVQPRSSFMSYIERPAQAVSAPRILLLYSDSLDGMRVRVWKIGQTCFVQFGMAVVEPISCPEPEVISFHERQP